jgi:hypothetical protein
MYGSIQMSSTAVFHFKLYSSRTELQIQAAFKLAYQHYLEN